MIKHYCDRCGRWIPLTKGKNDRPFMKYGYNAFSFTNSKAKEICSNCYEDLINFMKVYEAEK